MTFKHAVHSFSVMTNFIAAILLTALAAGPHTAVHSQGRWSLVTDESGIRVYNRPVPGSSVDEFRGETIIDAPLQDVLAVLSDIPSHTAWRANCMISRVVKKHSSRSLIMYNVTRAPLPLAYRDVVLRVTMEFSADRKRAVISMQSMKSDLVPQDSRYVRMNYLQGTWILERIAPGKTRVVYTIRSDPGGNIPASIANIASRKLPLNTLIGLKKMVGRKQR